MTLQDLITAVEGAEGRLDNETLGRVICAVEGVEFYRSQIACGDDGSDELNVYGGGRHVWGGYRHLAPDVSIDAAVALIERRMPGWYRGHQQNRRFPHPDDFSFWLESPAAKSREYHEGSGKTDALAACAALLRALQSPAQENRKDVS